MWAWGRLGTLATCCLILAGAAECEPKGEPPQAAVAADAIGVYEGDYGNGYREVVKLHSDGTLEQVFTRYGDEILRSRGTWRIDAQRGLLPCHFFRCYDPFKVAPDYAPRLTDNGETLWDPARGAIAFSDWPNDRLVRASKTIPPPPEPVDMEFWEHPRRVPNAAKAEPAAEPAK